MKSITFHCEVITPMFLAGADGKIPELRPPSIKGAMRFWWRAVNGHLNLKTLKEKEAEIFGNQEKRSKVEVVVEYNQKLLKDKFVKNTRLVSHKSFTAPAIQPGYKFTVTLLSNDAEKLKTAANIFILFSFLGGLGKRSRRGFGSFRIKNFTTNDFYFQNNFRQDILRSVFQCLQELNQGKFKIKEQKIISQFYKGEKYPFIKEIKIGRKDNDILRKIAQTTHDLKFDNKIPYETSLGNTYGGGRFASPVYVSLCAAKTPIITTLNTVTNLNPLDINLQLQEKFKQNIL